MIKINDKTKCNGCHACFIVCPTNAITMLPDNEGFLYPSVDEDACVKCKKCINVCPEINPYTTNDAKAIYAAYRNDFNKRLESQSGGLFAALAESIIEEGGVAFGATYDNDWKVIHTHIYNKAELNKLFGSKYVQSEISDSYKIAKEYLNKEKKVLFSGTPCQIQGLKSYLGKEYENLITVDLICHGVPSPLVWNKYLNERLDIKELKQYTQKDKTKDNSIRILLKDGSEVFEKYDDNIFTKGFNKNLYLRPSCHICSFKGIDRCSDITIGDFWGIENYHPEFYDKYGISAVVVHTEKGQGLFNKIKSSLNVLEANEEMLVAENPCMIAPTNYNEKRELFFNNINNKDMIPLVVELTKPASKDVLKKKINDTKYQVRSFLGRTKNKLLKR